MKVKEFATKFQDLLNEFIQSHKTKYKAGVPEDKMNGLLAVMQGTYASLVGCFLDQAIKPDRRGEVVMNIINDLVETWGGKANFLQMVDNSKMH